MTSLLNKNNDKLAYNIISILINISYLDNGEKLFYLDENICCNIASFLGNNRNEKDLLHYGIILLKNIFFDKNVCDIFTKYKITEFFEEIYEKYLLNKEFMEHLMEIISHIIVHQYNEFHKTSKVNLSIVLPLIKIIATQIRINYEANLLYKYLYRLYQLCTFQETDIYYEIVNCKLHKDFMCIYPAIEEKVELLKENLKEILSSSKGEIINKEQLTKSQKDLDYYEYSLLVILKILGKLMCLDDNILTQTLLNSGISSFLTKTLHSHDLRVIKNVCFCMCNICSGTYGQTSYLFNDNTLYELIKISKNILDAIELRQEIDDYYSQLLDTFKEINLVFSLTIYNSLSERIVPFCQCENYTVIIVLVKGLKYLLGKNNEDVINTIFEAINKIIMFKTDFVKNILFIMEKYGLKENLENIIITGNLSISKTADEIHESLFGLI